MSNTSTQITKHMHVYVFAQTFKHQTFGVRKTFWQLQSCGVIACRISLESGRWSSFFPLPSLLLWLLWPVSPSWHLCGVFGPAVPTTQSDRSAFPGFIHSSRGIMRSWARRSNFAFLIFALRVWCLSTARENADNTVHNTEGKLSKSNSISHLYLCWCWTTVW